VLVAGVDLLLGTERVAVGALILPVLLTAATLWPRGTAAIGGIALIAAGLVLLLVDVPAGTTPPLRLAVLALGAAACVWGAARGAAAQQRSQEATAGEWRFRTALDTADEGVVVLDCVGCIVFANHRMADILGVGREDILGKPVGDILGNDARRSLRTPASSAGGQRPNRHELRHRRPDGRLVHLLASGRPLLDEAGHETGRVGFYTDVTGHKQAEQELLRMALHDELTGLPNRALMVDRLGHELARRGRPPVAVLLLDLDQFKAVNDALGHSLGDRLLQQVASRLVDAVRPFDTVARLGGDEFAIVCPDIGDGNGAAAVARRVERTLAAPIDLAGLEMTVTASIGLALATPPPAPTDVPAGIDEPEPDLPDRLLREADAAMYTAKRQGRARFEVYDPSMGEQASDRLRVLSELRAGLGRDELRLHYQPIIDIRDGRTRGVESLVRWQHPQRGLLLPDAFLPWAEESGLLVDLGAWVLRAASQQGARWQRDRPLSISVNLSVRQLLHRDLVSQVRQLLDESGLPAQQLTLEVTETALIADLRVASQVLDQLRGLGVRLALDDFGTGYSSLAYLRHLPVDELKLDRSFLVDLDDPASQAVVSAVIDVAHALDMTVVGEGVERPDQLAALGRLGCDLAQGFLCGRPASASDLRPG
jgi:diguanylate cyclase (GGDEF)-like protein/PAS domain S-box-containing protein